MRSVPGNRPVSVGRSAPLQGVPTSGYRPRTRNDPPGGGVRRREVVPPSAGLSGGSDGVGPAVEEDAAGVEAGPPPDVGPPPRGVAAHASATTTNIAATVRARAAARRILEGPALMATTLACEGPGGPPGPDRRGKCDKTALFGLTAPTHRRTLAVP